MWLLIFIVPKKHKIDTKKGECRSIDGSRAESGRLGPTTFRYFFFQKYFFQGRPESGRVEKTRPDSKKSRPESGRVEFFLVFFFLGFFFLEKILLWGGPTGPDSARLGLTRADSGRVFFSTRADFFFFKNFFFDSARVGPTFEKKNKIKKSRPESARLPDFPKTRPDSGRLPSMSFLTHFF